MLSHFLNVASINSPLLPTPCSTSRNQTNFLSRWCTMRGSRSFPSTALAAAIRMNSRNHLPSTASRILVTLSFHPMKHLTSFQERLLRPSTSRHNTDGGQTIIINIPRATRRQPDHRSLRSVTHHRRVSTRRTRNLSTISRPKLNVAHHRSLKNLPQRQDITNLKTRFAAK